MFLLVRSFYIYPQRQTLLMHPLVTKRKLANFEKLPLKNDLIDFVKVCETNHICPLYISHGQTVASSAF